MSPEQILSPAEVDSRSDIWSLGVILYELLAACAPFEAKTVTELVSVIATGPTPSIRALRPDVPLALEGVIAKCLEKKQAERYADVAELSAALAPFAPPRAKALVARIGSIVAASKAAAARLPAPPFALSFAAFQVVPEAASRTQRPHTVLASWSQVVMALVLVSAFTAFVAALWQRDMELPEAPRAQATQAAKAQPVARLSPSGSGRAAQKSAADHATPARADSATPARSDPATPLLFARAPDDTRGAQSAPASAGSARRGVKLLRVRSSSAVAKPAQPHARCNPPYYFDRNGNRMFKKECV